MSVQLTAIGQMLRVDAGAASTIPRAFTATAQIKVDQLAVAGTVLTIITTNFKLYRLRWSGSSWGLVNSDGATINVGGTASTSEWVSVALRVTTFAVSGGVNTRVAAFVRNAGGSTLSASADTVQFVDNVQALFVGNHSDYYAADITDGRNTARFKAADYKAWSVVLSQSEIEAEWAQQAPARTTDRVVVNYFDGGSIAAAQASDYAIDTWAQTWDARDSDGSPKALAAYSAESPTYGGVVARVLAGSDTLPAIQ